MDTGPFFDCTMRYPLGKGNETIYKATAVKLGPKGDAGAVFDRNTLRLSAAWTGGFLNQSDRRFGLLNTPTPKGNMLFATNAGPGWADPKGMGDLKGISSTAPLPREWAKYRGLHLSDSRTTFVYIVGKTEILESISIENISGIRVIVRTLLVAPREKMETVAVGSLGKPSDAEVRVKDVQMIDVSRPKKGFIIFAAKVDPRQAQLHEAGGGVVRLTFAPSKTPVVARVIYANSDEINHPKFRRALENLPAAEDLTKLTKGGPKRWGEPLVTKLVRGHSEGPLAVDTLTTPYKNRFNALFFCTGLDFLKDGRIAVCTAHGDVWLVTVDEKTATCAWQRHATGLYHPLGLKVVDGKVVVLERGQLTRLHDLNNDGEADFYECVNNDWDTGAGEHSYDTCLETDPQGNFYFFKTGDTNLPTGGCLMKVSKDGSKSEVFSTGFRHPIGLGMSPTGILTGADQEGNWMPATRIDEYKKGGFYGDMRAHHRATAPTIYDPPLCWAPHEVDNSAGGQVWVPAKTWGALAGLPLHLSYGRCKAFVLLRQELPNGGVQGGVAPLGVTFLSGVCRGRFGSDGNLYVCGLNGWQTAAQADGCLQRVRATGKPVDLPTAMEVKGKTIRLTFSRPLDPKAVAVPENYRAARWNYRWSGDYGSKRWKVSDPKVEGQDEVVIRGSKLSADGRTVEITFDTLMPVMQMMVGYNVKAADGKPVAGSVYLTIHDIGK